MVVDYAHTSAALEKVLGELRPATRGRLWVVFGSAGERDREKRGTMGGVAARLADVVVVTDEDPRGEDRVAILEEIGRAAEAAGATRGDRLHLIPDRDRGDRLRHRGRPARVTPSCWPERVTSAPSRRRADRCPGTSAGARRRRCAGGWPPGAGPGG